MNPRRLKAVAKKEFIHVLRDWRSLFLALAIPMVLILLFGYALDLDLKNVQETHAEVVTAFEILEHLVAPFNVLRAIPGDKLLASVPLRLWFASAYRSRTDPWDRHYHEFEDWQFDWLLEKSGWHIRKSEKWSSPVNKIGFRPILRKFTPRYYAVYAER